MNLTKYSRKASASGLGPKLALCSIVAAIAALPVMAAVDLADSPVVSNTAVPGNLMLALSVEYPTASTPAYLSTSAYSTSKTYVGYFDPAKCYAYSYNSGAPAQSYFYPVSAATSSFGCTSTSTGLWGGNYMNYVSMQTLDIFRWALTGGARGINASDDSSTTTILQKTFRSNQDGSLSPVKTLSSGISSATPFTWSAVLSDIHGGTTLGWAMYFYPTGGAGYTVVDYMGESDQASALATSGTLPRKARTDRIYKVYVRVKVCDSSVGLEANCQAYGSNYKPEGLMQKYSSKLRYGAFGYLNDGNVKRDGGVLRSKIKSVGPNLAAVGTTSPINPNAEWNSSTGVMVKNPDPTEATATTSATSSAGYAVTIDRSGTINYLNLFGTVGGDALGSSFAYKTYDPVSEMYYGAQRYFRGLGNISAYSSLSGAGSLTTMKQWVDYFPVISTWDDPISYSCQKNFILGIGDVYTHRDRNIPGTTITSSDEPTNPTTGDTSVNIYNAMRQLNLLEGTTGLETFSSGRNNSYFVAGLAYDAHTNDIRPTISGTQTISTYWLDVLESQKYEKANQYYLATKYGGFTVPTGFNPYATTLTSTTLATSSWHTNTDKILSTSATYVTDTTSGTGDLRPDNYFTAIDGNAMVSSLKAAFDKIVAENDQQYSTAFSVSTPNQKLSGGASYAASYDPKTWTGQVIASSIVFDLTAKTITLTKLWDARDALDQRTPASRMIVTCCDSSGNAIPFQTANLGVTSFGRTNYASFSSISGVSAGSQSQANYLAYLRGDRSKEVSSASSSAASSTGIYRQRTHLLGDVVDADVLPVGKPAGIYYDSSNPGYSTFKLAYANRRQMVYAAANDGMLHAFDGTVPASAASSSASSTSSACTLAGKCGYEMFAFIPSFTYGSSSSAATSGLASLGSPTSFSHHFFVDATPTYADVDMMRAGTSATPSTQDWHTILVGGLGKGGKGIYSLDITDPSLWSSESWFGGTSGVSGAKRVWEFPSSAAPTDASLHMGYYYGTPDVVKTKKYGWVIIITSGYNNDDGKGYFYFIDPKTGALLDYAVTPIGSLASPVNLSGQTSFVPDSTDGTADSVYAGDISGRVWRVDLTGTGSYSSTTVQLFATLNSPSAASSSGGSAAQPITVRPRIVSDQTTTTRYVVVGTGSLLGDSDVTSMQVQSIYVILDGTISSGGFYTGSPLSASGFSRSDMIANDSSMFMGSGVGTLPSGGKYGWYLDLTTSLVESGGYAATSSSSSSAASSASSAASTAKYAFRILNNIAAYNGVILFAVDRPTGDVCDLNGEHTTMAFTLSGITASQDASGAKSVSSGLSGSLSAGVSFGNVDGTGVGISTDRKGNATQPRLGLTGTINATRLNWREVPSID